MGLNQSAPNYQSVRTISDSDESDVHIPIQRKRSKGFQLQVLILALAILYALVSINFRSSNQQSSTALSDSIPPRYIVDRAIVQSCTVNSGTASGCPNQFYCLMKNWEMLEEYGSTVPVVYMVDKKEAYQVKMCEELAQKHSFPIHCILLKEELAGGWGYPKITAVLNAPARNLLWFDCDVMVTGTVDHLFDNKDFQKTGSVWWVSPARNFPNPFAGYYRGVYKGTDPATIPWEEWVDVSEWDPHQIEMGFDSGSFMLNYEKTKRAMDFLLDGIANKTTRAFLEAWSMGDKDTWHMALLMTKTNFTVMPWLGKLGDGGWYGTRFGHDFEGNPLYFHGNLGATNITILVDIRKPDMMKCVLEKMPNAETCPTQPTLPLLFEKYQKMVEKWNTFNREELKQWIERANDTLGVINAEH